MPFIPPSLPSLFYFKFQPIIRKWRDFSQSWFFYPLLLLYCRISYIIRMELKFVCCRGREICTLKTYLKKCTKVLYKLIMAWEWSFVNLLKSNWGNFPWNETPSSVIPPPLQKMCFIGGLSVVAGGGMLMSTAFAPLSIVSYIYEV